ncbi:MAG: cupin domain-containing protein [Brevibacterium sp.]
MSATEPIETHDFPLTHEPIEDWQRVDKADTTTGFAELGTIGGVDYGLWEMSAGAMRDVEGDEVFLVISGRGRIEFDEPVIDEAAVDETAVDEFAADESGAVEPAQSDIALAPGTLVRLKDGMRTRWYIDEGPLRKLFIAEHEE